MNVLWIAPFLFLYCGLVGFLLVRRLPLIPEERLWLSPSLGLALLVLLATALAFAGALNLTGILIGLAALPLAVLVLDRILGRSATLEWETLQREMGEPASSSDNPGLIRWIAAASACGVILHSLLGALTPEVRSDPVRYHISMANQYAVRGGIEPLRETVWWTIPQYAECLYAFGMVLANDALAKLFHWFAGLLSIAGVYALGVRWFSEKSVAPPASPRRGRDAQEGRAFRSTKGAWWAVLLWSLVPKLTYEMTTTYVEGFLILWTLLMVWAATRGLAVAQDKKAALAWMTLSGAFLGLGCGTKYTTLGVQAVPWLVFPAMLLWRWRRDPRAILSLVAPFVAIALFDAPWLIRNSHHTGNPFYPLYNHLFGLTSDWDRGAEAFFLTVWPGKDLLNPLFYMERFEGLFLSGYNFPSFAILVGAILLLRRNRPETSDLWKGCPGGVLVFCLWSLIHYLVLTGNMDGRFFLPSLAVFTVLLGEGLSRLPRLLFFDEADPARTRRWERILILGVGVFCVHNYVNQRIAFFHNFGESPWPILSEEARMAYYLKHQRADPAGDFFLPHFVRGDLVYNLGFPYSIPGITPVVERTLTQTGEWVVSNPDPVETPFSRSSGTPGDLLEILREEGISYVVLPPERSVHDKPLWRTVRQACELVPGTEGRLYRVPRG